MAQSGDEFARLAMLQEAAEPMPQEARPKKQSKNQTTDSHSPGPMQQIDSPQIQMVERPTGKQQQKKHEIQITLRTYPPTLQRPFG